MRCTTRTRRPSTASGISAEISSIERILGFPGERSTHCWRSLTDEGFLGREDRVVTGKVRKYDTIAPLGRRALKEARAKALELVNEITEDDETAEQRGSRCRLETSAG